MITTADLGNNTELLRITRRSKARLGNDFLCYVFCYAFSALQNIQLFIIF